MARCVLLRRLAAFALAVILTSGGAAAQAPAPGQPPAASAPVTCRIGAFLISLHDVDTASRTFKADLWLWSVCPTREIEPLKTLEFVNAVETHASLDSVLQRGDRWWATRKISGHFRQPFELESYPFDRHPLVIEMEESVSDTRSLQFVADQVHSGMDPKVVLPGWNVKDFVVRGGMTEHPTTFGDPSLETGISRYAAIHLILHAERAHFATFVKLTIALYIAAFMVLVSLLFDVSNTDLFIGRIGMHASALFAVVLNFIAAGATVGHHESLSLLDEVHVTTLGLILATTLWSVFAYRAAARGAGAAVVRRWDAWSAGIFLVLFLLTNAWLFADAMRKGSDHPALYAASRRLIPVSAEAPLVTAALKQGGVRRPTP